MTQSVRMSRQMPIYTGHAVVRDRLAGLLREDETMIRFVDAVKTFLKEEDGPTAVEYAVMLALIVIVCLTAIRAVGTATNAKFNQIATELNAG